jgi:hypothetical protein
MQCELCESKLALECCKSWGRLATTNTPPAQHLHTVWAPPRQRGPPAADADAAAVACPGGAQLLYAGALLWALGERRRNSTT